MYSINDAKKECQEKKMNPEDLRNEALSKAIDYVDNEIVPEIKDAIERNKDYALVNIWFISALDISSDLVATILTERGFSFEKPDRHLKLRAKIWGWASPDTKTTNYSWRRYTTLLDRIFGL